jgi:hypothetical protein
VVLVVGSGCQVTQLSLHDAVKNHEIDWREEDSQLVSRQTSELGQ